MFCKPLFPSFPVPTIYYSTLSAPTLRAIVVHFCNRCNQSGGRLQGPGTVDLWDGHAISNRAGVYSGYNYAERAAAVIENFTATNTALVAAGRAAEADSGMFMYLAWHNTHTPTRHHLGPRPLHPLSPPFPSVCFPPPPLPS